MLLPANGPLAISAVLVGEEVHVLVVHGGTLANHALTGGLVVVEAAFSLS